MYVRQLATAIVCTVLQGEVKIGTQGIPHMVVLVVMVLVVATVDDESVVRSRNKFCFMATV